MVKMKNFELQKSYISQKKAENVYKTDSARKNNFFAKKGIFFNFFDFSRHARGPPEIFDAHFFESFKNKFQKWLYWVLSDIERNKVMNFGDPSPNPVETADCFQSSGP